MDKGTIGLVCFGFILIILNNFVGFWVTTRAALYFLHYRIVLNTYESDVGRALVALQGINIKIFMTDRRPTRGLPTFSSKLVIIQLIQKIP